MRDFTRAICKHYEVPLLDVVSLIALESGWGTAKGFNDFSPDRYYGRGYVDIGYMQLSSRYFYFFKTTYFDVDLLKELGYSRQYFDARDPFINIQIGVAYFSTLLRKFGDVERAAMAYNAGPYKPLEEMPLVTVLYAKSIANNQIYRYKYLPDA